MPAVHPLDGPLRLDPGKCGRSATFAFLNVSPWPICDLRITTWDDGLGFTPEILPSGFRMSSFDPRPLPGDRIGVRNERPIPPDDYDRSNDDEETDETYVTFKPGKCIQPGKGFTLNLTFDETLDGREGIEISPSRLYDGEHYAIGSTEAKRPPPFTYSDLLRILGEIGVALPLGGLIGQRTDPARRREALLAIPQNRLALAALLDRPFADTPVARLHKLPVRALTTLTPEKAEAFEAMGYRTIRDLVEDPDVRRALFLYTLARGAPPPPDTLG